MAESHPVPRDEHLQGQDTGMWLRNSPIYFVRTTAFVALIADLHYLLQDEWTSNRDAYIAVRRVTRLLAAFVEEAERKPRPVNPPGDHGLAAHPHLVENRRVSLHRENT